MRRVVTSTLLLACIVLLIPEVAYSAVKQGSVCTKVGKTAKSAGVTYRCTRSGKRLVWSKILVPVKPSPTPSSSPSPISSAVKHVQIITVPVSKSVDITEGSLPDFFSVNSHLPLELSATTSGTCGIQNQVIVLLSTGTCTVSASQPGDADYLPAESVTYSFQVAPPLAALNDPLLEGVKTYIRVPLGSTFSNEFIKISLVAFNSDASTKVCANDPTANGCTSLNGTGIPDPTSMSKYVEFAFHVENLSSGPVPPIFYRLLFSERIADIDTGVFLETLNGLSIYAGQTANGSFFGTVPKDQSFAKGYLLIDAGVTDSSTRILMSLTQ